MLHNGTTQREKLYFRENESLISLSFWLFCRQLILKENKISYFFFFVIQAHVDLHLIKLYVIIIFFPYV